MTMDGNPPRYDESTGVTVHADEDLDLEKQKEAAKEAERYQQSADRGAWGSQLEFILTCVGSAVGLGNVWRFPYLCYKNGGGAFLLPYVIMLAIVGLPIFYFELCFGQFSSLGPIRIWLVSPLSKGIGFAMVSVTLLIGLTYMVIMSWSIFYLIKAMTTDFPWNSCDNGWNDARCFVSSELSEMNRNQTLLNATLEERNLTSNLEFETASEQFFYHEVLQMSANIEDFGVPVWTLTLCMLLGWTLVFVVLIKGISSLGKVVYVFTIFPYILITILLVFSCTLDGAIKGIEFYIKPDVSRLADAEVWADAATQIFYSLSACSGGLIAMSSYNKFNNNVYRDSLIIPFINCFTSVYSGFAIFAVLGFIANMKNVDVADVADEGPGLVFVVYPEALSQMPVPTLWSILFFLMLVTLGFSSEFALVESIFVSILDEFPRVLRSSPWRPIVFRGVCCLFFFAISIPMLCNGGFYIFSLVDKAAGGYPLLFIGLLELITVNWVYGINQFSEDVKMMLGRRPNIFFRAFWVAINPVLLLGLIVTKAIQQSPLEIGDYMYPAWGETLYWLITMFVLGWIPLVALYMFCSRGGYQVLREVAAPRRRWGPALPENRTGRYAVSSVVVEPTEKKADLEPIPTLTAREECYENKGFVIEEGVHKF